MYKIPLKLNPTNLLPLAWLLLLGSVWGSTIIITKHIVSSDYQPLGLIFWQLAFGALLLSIIARFRSTSLPMSWAHVRFYSVVALVGTVIPNTFTYMVAAYIPAGLLAIGIATVPMFSLLIALAIKSERFNSVRMLGILLGALAIALVLGPDADFSSQGLGLYMLVALIAPFFYAIEGNYLALKTPPNMHPLNILYGASVVGLVICTPLTFLTGSWVDLSQAWTSVEWGILANSVLHVIAYVGYIWIVGLSGAVFASQVAYIVTLSGVLLGILILGESHSSLIWIALGCMILGLILVQPRKVTNSV
ncbi:MAG: DMT family transporter [Oceanospirillaceae bacterium]|nr:DMT family transporter [Pseudomonadales bacterium]